MFLPYVYIVRNRVNSKFYIGMRSANKVVAEQDLGIHYFTSSKYVKNNFSDFDIEIKAYFIDQISAFEFENELIKENWGNPLLLNRHYQKSMSKFSMAGAKRSDLAEYNKKTKSKPKEERIYTCIICKDIFTRLEFCHHLPKLEFVCGHKCNGIRAGRKRTGPNYKLQETRKNNPRTPWNKGKIGTGFGKINPMHDPEKVKKNIESRKRNGSKTGFAVNNPMSSIEKRNKLSNAVTGRKKVMRNGKSTWSYPEDYDYPTTSVTEQVGTISEY